MKKTIILVSLAAAFVFAACQKNQNPSAEGYTLSATIEQQAAGIQTKTYLDNNIVKWSEGDQILLYTDNSTPEGLTMILKSGAGTTSGKFITDATPAGNPDCAIYPASAFRAYDGATKTFTFTLPATQNYVENSFDNGANVSVAKVNGKNMDFLNTCGVLKLQLSGAFAVKSITIKGNNGEKLWGEFSSQISTTGGGPTCVAGERESGDDILTLSCPSNGTPLSEYTPTSFYFVVPVGVFGDATKSGFTATINTMNGETKILSTDKINTVRRSGIRTMPESALGYPSLSSDYQRVEYLKSTGQDTYIQINNYNIIFNKLELYFDYLTEKCPNYSFFFGSYNIPGMTNLYSCYYNGKQYYSLGSGEISANTVNTNRHLLHMINDEELTYFYFDDNLIGTSKIYYTLPEYAGKFAIFGRSTTDSAPGRAGDGLRIYSLKILSDKYYKSIFIPVRRVSDSVLGMYDLYNGTFYTNSSTGTFVAGPDVTD